jgi:hypothetical protein
MIVFKKKRDFDRTRIMIWFLFQVNSIVIIIDNILFKKKNENNIEIKISLKLHQVANCIDQEKVLHPQYLTR